MSGELFDIDGSILEGGGQVLRISLTFSVIKGIPIRITNIRLGRSKPGLREQHLKGVELLRDICNANVKGASLGSTTVEFRPGKITGGHYEAKIRTAGSISLLLQVVLPCTLLGQSQTVLKLHGGTNAEMAPQIDYMTKVFRPNLEKFGGTFGFELIKRGYFPKGAGKVIINVKPIEAFNPINSVDFGQITSIHGWSYVAGSLPIKLAHSMADSATEALKRIFNDTKIERYKEDSSVAADNGSGIILVAETNTGCFVGGSAIGKSSEAPEETGQRAAMELLKSIEEGACFDEYMQDQIIVFMAFAKGSSKVRVGQITLHTRSVIAIAHSMTKAKFHLTHIPESDSYFIECTGNA